MWICVRGSKLRDQRLLGSPVPFLPKPKIRDTGIRDDLFGGLSCLPVVHYELDHDIHDGCDEQPPVSLNQTKLLVRGNGRRSIRSGNPGPFADCHRPSSHPRGPLASRFGYHYRGVHQCRHCTRNSDD